MKRQRFDADDSSPRGGGLYFTDPEVETFTSGCAVLDCALGGGWAVGRIGNVVGDKSTGKTLLMIEAIRYFLKAYPEGKVAYAEVEAAFDKGYARALGLPVEEVSFRSDPEEKEGREILTVEDWFEDLLEFIKSVKGYGLYILDSLDALSDRAELARDLDAATYGASKAKQMSQLFRRLVQKLSHTKITVLIVSQVRDNIGASFGRMVTRSGGRALDFYASQVVYLAHLRQLKRCVNKVERPVGIQVKAKVDKNKIGLPLREVEFPILFGFGVEDVIAAVDWLLSVKQHRRVFTSEDHAKRFKRGIDKLSPKDYRLERRKLAKAVRKAWIEVERGFIPKRRKM